LTKGGVAIQIYRLRDTSVTLPRARGDDETSTVAQNQSMLVLVPSEPRHVRQYSNIVEQVRTLEEVSFVVSRPRFGCQVTWWWRGGGASQAEPGTSAKGHLADRTLVSISVSSPLS
jgi:hypothetical protein